MPTELGTGWLWGSGAGTHLTGVLVRTGKFRVESMIHLNDQPDVEVNSFARFR